MHFHELKESDSHKSKDRDMHCCAQYYRLIQTAGKKTLEGYLLEAKGKY